MAKDERKPKGRRDWRPKFIAGLESNGIVSTACRVAGIGRSTAYDARRKDQAFADAWDEAIELAIGVAEGEAYRRAVHGVVKPVYQGGVKVGEITEYSDTLLIFILRALKPEKYREPKGDVHIHAAEPAAPSPAARAALDAAQLIADGGVDVGPDDPSGPR